MVSAYASPARYIPASVNPASVSGVPRKPRRVQVIVTASQQWQNAVLADVHDVLSFEVYVFYFRLSTICAKHARVLM